MRDRRKVADKGLYKNKRRLKVLCLIKAVLKKKKMQQN